MPRTKTQAATATVTLEEIAQTLAHALQDVLSVDDAKVFGRAWESSRKEAREALGLFQAWQSSASRKA